MAGKYKFLLCFSETTIEYPLKFTVEVCYVKYTMSYIYIYIFIFFASRATQSISTSSLDTSQVQHGTTTIPKSPPLSVEQYYALLWQMVYSPGCNFWDQKSINPIAGLSGSLTCHLPERSLERTHGMQILCEDLTRFDR